MLEYIMNNWESMLVIATAVVTAASGIAALTPTPVDDGILLKVRKVLDVVALNIGNAKNK